MGKTTTETHEMLKITYGMISMSHAEVFNQFGRFENGTQSVDHNEKLGRLSTSITSEYIAKLEGNIRADHRKILHEVCDELEIPQCGTYNNVANFNKRFDNL